jgi:hypothetical protein
MTRSKPSTKVQTSACPFAAPQGTVCRSKRCARAFVVYPSLDAIWEITCARSECRCQRPDRAYSPASAPWRGSNERVREEEAPALCARRRTGAALRTRDRPGIPRPAELPIFNRLALTIG